jgi:hypothetical protein
MSPPGPIIMTCQSHGVIILGVAVVFILAKFFHLVAQKKGAVGSYKGFLEPNFLHFKGRKKVEVARFRPNST